MEVISVTDRKLCKGDFLNQIERIYKGGADKIILREKDLGDDEYSCLAKECYEICGDKLYINSRSKIAKELNIKNIHLPISIFKYDGYFESMGASVHSVDEAVLAESMGAGYIIAGHVFPTLCKKDLPPRGVDFINKITESVTIPVYAIGGIKPTNVGILKSTGIKGVSIMSGLMEAEAPERLIEIFKLVG